MIRNHLVLRIHNTRLSAEVRLRSERFASGPPLRLEHKLMCTAILNSLHRDPPPLCSHENLVALKGVRSTSHSSIERLLRHSGSLLRLVSFAAHLSNQRGLDIALSATLT